VPKTEGVERRNPMRRILLAFIVLAALVSAAVGAGAAGASTTVRFEASFAESLCEGGNPCGSAVVASFGTGSYLLHFGDALCTAEQPALVTLTLTDGSTLRWCQIGINRVDVQGGLIEPFSGPFTVLDGTGVFAGATGGGIQVAIWVHDRETGELRVARRHYNGTLTLP